jgi:hypothetical protein
MFTASSLADTHNTQIHIYNRSTCISRVVTGEKNSPTVAHACRKRRLKWVLPQVGGWSTGLETLSL